MTKLSPLIRSAKPITSLSPSALQSHLIAASSSRPLPLHLPDLVSSWPALDTWRLEDGLKVLRDSIGENRSVEVELGKRGRGYLHKDWQRVWMPFGLFLDAFILNLIPSSSSPSLLPLAYLAQSDILDTSPSLLETIPALPHFLVGKEKIIGKKTFHILPPEARHHLDISALPRHTNTSQIPLPVSRIFSPTSLSPFSSKDDLDDLSDLPPDTVASTRVELERAFELPGACQVDVNAGESVLIPEGWWHAAEGVEGAGVGVNAWFR
nr:uncharacterized protein CI109_001254 [Kwoniella shandongensis]KAA5530451.1 hypothetical protein CI109_001254 [Kwoniella shandongensis]